MENVNYVKINIEIDTNKGAYKEEFDDIYEAKDWLEEKLSYFE